MDSPVATGHRARTRTDMELELHVRSGEEAIYVARTREGFHRIVRCLEGGLVNEAYDFAAAGLAIANRRRRQLDPEGGNAA